MLQEIILAIVQAATEFLPLSSSGHLALVSNLISRPNIFFFTALHLASLIAVIIFTRKEITALLTFKKEYRAWWLYLAIATLPALTAGFLFRAGIEGLFSSYLFIGGAFLFTGVVLFLTRFSSARSGLSAGKSVIIGLTQVLGLLPGVSRSGVTIASSLFLGVKREEATKFSFLLFIPLCLGAFVLEMTNGYYFDISLAASFVVCLLLSLLSLRLLFIIVKKRKFWLFSLYCFLIGLASLSLHFFG